MSKIPDFQDRDIIVRQVEHITGLVDDLIDVSRVTRGLISTDKKPCDIARIVEQAVEQARPAIAEMGSPPRGVVSASGRNDVKISRASFRYRFLRGRD